MHAFLLLTTQCNEACRYCDFPLISNSICYNKDNIDWDAIYHILNFYYIHNHAISIVGGEPGLLSINKLQHIFNIIPEMKYTILTNGLFLKNNYHNQFNKNIGHIGFHLVDFDWDLSEFKSIPSIDYRVVLDTSYDLYLDELLKYAEFYNIQIIIKYDTGRIVGDYTTLTTDQYIDIYERIKDSPYIYEKSKRRALYLISEQQSQECNYKKCMYTKCVVTQDLCLDLVTNSIKPCFATYTFNHNDFDLNIHTIYDLLINPLNLKGLPCDHCTGYENIPIEGASTILTEINNIKQYTSLHT